MSCSLTYMVVTEDELGPERQEVHSADGHDAAAPQRWEHDHVFSDPGTALSPPSSVDEWSVVHHGLHHLALLAETNAEVRSALSNRDLAALRPLGPASAGVLSVEQAL
jgi:hypothetical protein